MKAFPATVYLVAIVSLACAFARPSLAGDDDDAVMAHALALWLDSDEGDGQAAAVPPGEADSVAVPGATGAPPAPPGGASSATSGSLTAIRVP